MKKVTNGLAPRVHDIKKDGQTEKVQFVPQLVSTLRLDLVLWSEEITGTLPPKMKL